MKGSPELDKEDFMVKSKLMGEFEINFLPTQHFSVLAVPGILTVYATPLKGKLHWKHNIDDYYLNELKKHVKNDLQLDLLITWANKNIMKDSNHDFLMRLFTSNHWWSNNIFE